nr:MAG TPA: hypothetical protein [Caudoviricetes sp.]
MSIQLIRFHIIDLSMSQAKWVGSLIYRIIVL